MIVFIVDGIPDIIVIQCQGKTVGLDVTGIIMDIWIIKRVDVCGFVKKVKLGIIGGIAGLCLSCDVIVGL